MEWFSNILNVYKDWLITLGMDSRMVLVFTEITLFILSVGLFYLVDRLFTYYVRAYIKRIISKSKTKYDDVLFENKVFSYFLHIISVYFWLLLVGVIFKELQLLDKLVTMALKLWIVYLLVRGILAFLKSANDIYDFRQTGRKRSIKSYIQVFQLIVIAIGSLIAISIIASKDISVLLTGLGAFAAVLMLVFKDSILGFVGGIQISANDLLRPGDWVSVPSAEADGVVIDISLTTVKIQNWDKTISTVPTYSLVSGSFHNWRGMEESGGRRIKRHINIDIHSIHFCSAQELAKLKEVGLLKEYILGKEIEIAEYNAAIQQETVQIDGRSQTNVGVFRAYVNAYLKAKKEINPEMTFLVRQLQATDRGLPLEIYVFSKVQEWDEYENIQADIFDHLFAVIPQFGLKVFQSPSGADLQSLRSLSK